MYGDRGLLILDDENFSELKKIVGAISQKELKIRFGYDWIHVVSNFKEADTLLSILGKTTPVDLVCGHDILYSLENGTSKEKNNLENRVCTSGLIPKLSEHALIGLHVPKLIANKPHLEYPIVYLPRNRLHFIDPQAYAIGVLSSLARMNGKSLSCF